MTTDPSHTFAGVQIKHSEAEQVDLYRATCTCGWRSPAYYANPAKALASWQRHTGTTEN